MWGTELNYKQMKKQFGHILATALALTTVNAYAIPTLEVMSASGTNRTGTNTTSKDTTFVFNPNNPIDNTTQDYYPTVKVNYSISNSYYTDGVVFGGDSKGDFVALKDQGFPSDYNTYSNSLSSSRDVNDIGKGISLDNNYGVRFLADFSKLQGKKWYTAGENSGMGYEIGDITLKWDRPVTNPVINISGVGGTVGGYGIAGQFKLLTTTGVNRLGLLSGRNTSVSGWDIKHTGAYTNNYTNTGTTAYTIGATIDAKGATGSIQVYTSAPITTLTFRVYFRTDASSSITSTIPSNTGGDAFIFSASSIDSMVGDLLLEKTNSVTQVPKGSNTTYTVRVTNKGPDTFTGTLLNDRLAQGLALVKVECSTATNNKCTDSSKIDAAKLFVSDADLTSSAITGQDTGALAKDAFYEVLVTAKVTGDVGTTTLNKASVKLPTMGSSTGVACSNQTGVGGSTGLTRSFNKTLGICSVTDTDTIIKPSADLVVKKTAEKPEYKAGDLVKYTIQAWNAGPSEITDAIVQDIVPSSLSSVQMVTCKANGSALCPTLSVNTDVNSTLKTPSFALPVTTKDANQNKIDYLEFTVTGLAFKTGSIVNTATINSALATEVDTTNNSSATTITVVNDAPVNTGNATNMCNGNQSVNLITDTAFNSYSANNVLTSKPYTINPSVVPYSVAYGTGTNGALQLQGKINWSYGIPKITGATLKIYVNGTAYAVLVTPGASTNSVATFTALNGATVTPVSFELGQYNAEPVAVNFTLTLPTTVTASVTDLKVDFQNISPNDSSNDAGDDIGFSLNSLNACLKPTVELKKVSTGGTGSFEFGSFTNLSANASYQIQSGEVVTTVTGTSQSIRLKNSTSAVESGVTEPVYANAGEAISFTEKDNTLYALRSVSCIDSNSVNSGNNSSFNAALSGNNVTISKDNVKFGAKLVCTVSNEKKAGYVFSGRVFNDNSGSTKDASKAYNAIVDNGEVGIEGSQIELQNCSTKAVLASTTTNANGEFSIQTLQEVFDVNNRVCLVQKNVADYQSVSSTKSASVTATTDASFDLFTITKNANVNTYDGFLFGDAQLQLILTQNGQKNIAAGDVVDYPHEIISKSVHKLGNVSPSNTQQPTTGQAWSSLVYYDVNCNGVVDVGEQQYDAALKSTALSTSILPDQKICLVQRVVSPSSAKSGDSLSAQFAVKHTPTVSGSSEKLSNKVQDMTTVGSAGLDLVKSVREVKSCPSTEADTTIFVKTNTLTKVQNQTSYLEYKINYTNNSTKNLINVTLKDAVPLGTSLKSMCTENNCNGVSSNTTPLNWNIAGVLAPRATGTVRFCVEVH